VLTTAGRVAVLAGCVVVAVATAWYAGAEHGVSAPDPPTGSVRLGPDPGEPVTEYLAELPGRLPASGVVAPALVQLADAVTPVRAAELAAGGQATVAVFRVPLPRVQTALRFEQLDRGAPATALPTAMLRARMAAEADVSRLTGRPRDVAAAEAAALGDPACECTLALVVRADRATLEAIAARPGVRAVDAAPAGATERELALSPLLPGQLERADPPPDDGPVPSG
jgi:hypothetical protein